MLYVLAIIAFIVISIKIKFYDINTNNYQMIQMISLWLEHTGLIISWTPLVYIYVMYDRNNAIGRST